ncbi:MAG: fatty acid desaturase [Sandaracinaceae bacterium]
MATATSDTGVNSGRAAPRGRADWLLHNVADYRQLWIVGTYWSLLFSMYFVEECRNIVFLLAAGYFSFLNAVVIHNHMHKGIFKQKRVNRVFRAILSFGALYPASANIASHNLVHHHFDDDGQPDWAAPNNTRFRWHLLNLLHFPNVVGPNTFNGVSRWALTTRQRDFRRQYMIEQAFAFGLTGALLVWDFWGGLFFIVLPQLWGARGILRINLIQHDGCDISSEWNHSRNFVGRGFNWVMCNNGYHTIHHNRAGLHWSVLAEVHDRECGPRTDASLNERSMILYLLRTFLFNFDRPEDREVALAERSAAPTDLAAREERRAEADAEALAS